MMKKSLVKVLLISMVCIFLTVGCSKQSGSNEEGKAKQTAEGETNEYSKISKESSLVDMAPGDSPDIYKTIPGAIVIVTCNGAMEDLNVEVDDDVLEGEKLSVNFKRYSCTVNEIIRLNDAEAFEGEIVLAVGMAVSGVFPEFKEGDKVIIAVKEASNGTPAEGCYIWNDISMYYVKEDGTIVAAYTEDSKFDGYTVDEFKALIINDK